MEVITGTVSRIIFRNEENCYTVFLLEYKYVSKRIHYKNK